MLSVFERQYQKMVKHTQTIRRQFVFDHIVGLTLKRLSELERIISLLFLLNLSEFT